ncbi:neurofascin-like, partial [Leptonychotes weddellii]|uniref:Neurofascin-like n=1 Tax=Leptonychotes weddellii TaxID=9713 RepID=A0A7F8Q8D4_LEPWE
SIQNELSQPPTITKQSVKDHIVDPRDNILIECEAKGNPAPSFHWTRNSRFFNIAKDPRVSMRRRSGTLVIDFRSGGRPEEYEGEYQCFARNKFGTALSNRIRLQVSKSPLWPKENLDPVVVQEGAPLTLQCNPPPGLPSPVIFWMSSYPRAAPTDVKIRVLNSTAISLQWNRVYPDTVQGQLREYRAYYWRESSLLKNLWVSQKRQQASFPGDRPRGVVSRLFPYSNYKLEMVVVNGRGDGPRSETKEFTTPEGVPSAPRRFRVRQPNLETINLEWDHPEHPNGILTGYTLKYVAFNGTKLGKQIVENFSPNQTKFTVQRADPVSRYRFTLSARTQVGSGEAVTEESPAPPNEATPTAAPPTSPPTTVGATGAPAATTEATTVPTTPSVAPTTVATTTTTAAATTERPPTTTSGTKMPESAPDRQSIWNVTVLPNSKWANITWKHNFGPGTDFVVEYTDSNHTKKTVPVKAQAQPVRLTDLYPGMTYTLRVYSRDNEGISSTIITFMTSTGERGSGLATPCKHGAFHSILSFLLVSPPLKEDSSHPFPTLHGVSRLLLYVSPQLPGSQEEPGRMHSDEEAPF